MLFRYKKWKFFVYARKRTKDFVVKPALKIDAHGDQVPPDSVVKLITDCANVYYQSDEYAGMDVVEFLNRMLDGKEQ